MSVGSFVAVALSPWQLTCVKFLPRSSRDRIEGMETLTYSVHIEPMEEGGYSVEVPALPGCVTWGSTYEEAIAMAKDAILAFLTSLMKHNEAIPSERQPHQPQTLGIQVSLPATA